MKVKDLIKILQDRNPEEDMYMTYNNRTEILKNVEITGKHKAVLLLTLETPKPHLRTMSSREIELGMSDINIVTMKPCDYLELKKKWEEGFFSRGVKDE